MLNHIGVIKYQMHVSTEAALIWYYDENFVQSYRVMIITKYLMPGIVSGNYIHLL